MVNIICHGNNEFSSTLSLALEKQHVKAQHISYIKDT
jgi:hypothetical protein